MARFNKKVSAVLKAWRGNEIGMIDAVRMLVELGWSADQAWTYLARH